MLYTDKKHVALPLLIKNSVASEQIKTEKQMISRVNSLNCVSNRFVCLFINYKNLCHFL